MRRDSQSASYTGVGRNPLRYQLERLRDTFIIPLCSVDHVPVKKPQKGEEAGARADEHLQQWMRWREEALRLAVILGFGTTILVILQLEADISTLTTAKSWCDAAWVPLDSGSSPSASSPVSSTGPSGLSSDREQQSFPAEPKYTSNATAACASLLQPTGTAEVSTLMGTAIHNHEFVLDGTAQNSMCGSFESECQPKRVQLEGFTDVFNSTAVGEAGHCQANASLSQVCGWVPDASACRKAEPLQSASNPACLVPLCSVPDQPCQTGPCVERFWCGEDFFGEVCADSRDDCRQIAANPLDFQGRFSRIALALAADGTFSHLESVYTSLSACQERAQYSQTELDGANLHAKTSTSELFPSAATSNGSLLFESQLIGEIQSRASSFTNGTEGVLDRSQFGMGTVPTMFYNSYLATTRLTITKEISVPYRLRSGYLRAFSACSKSDEDSKVNLDRVRQRTGLQFWSAITAKNCNNAAQMPEYPEKVFTVDAAGQQSSRESTSILGYKSAAEASTLLFWSWGGTGSQSGSYMTGFTMVASCCSLPVIVSAVTGKIGAGLNIAGSYSAEATTFDGRPVYFGSNLGPQMRGLFIFFYSGTLQWYIGPEWPDPSNTLISSGQNEKNFIERTTYLSVAVPFAASPEYITKTSTWTITKAGQVAAGYSCDDLDAAFQAFATTPTFLKRISVAARATVANLTVTGCVDVQWLKLFMATPPCDQSDIAGYCKKSCGECEGETTACADASTSVIQAWSDSVLGQSFENCSQMAQLCDSPVAVQRNLTLYCPAACGQCPCAEEDMTGEASAEDKTVTVSRTFCSSDADFLPSGVAADGKACPQKATKMLAVNSFNSFDVLDANKCREFAVGTPAGIPQQTVSQMLEELNGPCCASQGTKCSGLRRRLTAPSKEAREKCFVAAAEKIILLTTTMNIAPTNGMLVCHNNYRDAASGAERYGALEYRNTASVDVLMRFAVRLKTPSADTASEIQRFRANLCVGANGNQDCVTSEPVSCFNDAVVLPPGTFWLVLHALRCLSLTFATRFLATIYDAGGKIDFPIEKGAGYASEVPLQWQSERDDTVAFMPAGVAAATSTAVAYHATTEVSAVQTAARRLADAACGATNSSSASSIGAETSTWSVCSATAHSQTKSKTCTAEGGTRLLENSLCEALRLGSPIETRSCCTDEELVRAEFLGTPSATASTMVLTMVPLLPPVWWAGAAVMAVRQRDNWRRSAKWVAAGWGIPFSIMFSQYLLPWQTIMGIDTAGLVSLLLSARSDNPTRAGVVAPSSTGSCDSNANASSTDLGALSALTGPSSTLGIMASAESASQARANIEEGASSMLATAAREQAKSELHAQYAKFADTQKQLYDVVERTGFALKSMVAMMPLALSLMPGIGRGALFTKLILPSSPLAGWIFRTVPLFYVPMLSVMTLGVVQLMSHHFVSMALFVYTLLALLPTFRSHSLAQAHHLHPHDIREEAWYFSTQSTALQMSFWVAMVGFVVGYIFSEDAAGYRADLEDVLAPFPLCVIIMRAMTNYFITAVLACDALLMLAVDVRVKEEARSDEATAADAACMEAAKHALDPGNGWTESLWKSARGGAVTSDGNDGGGKTPEAADFMDSGLPRPASGKVTGKGKGDISTQENPMQAAPLPDKVVGVGANSNSNVEGDAEGQGAVVTGHV
jgi:hypothetical protein